MAAGWRQCIKERSIEYSIDIDLFVKQIVISFKVKLPALFLFSQWSLFCIVFLNIFHFRSFIIYD